MGKAIADLKGIRRRSVISQGMWRVLEGGNGPHFRARRRMESFIQTFKKWNSGPKPKLLREGFSPRSSRKDTGLLTP